MKLFRSFIACFSTYSRIPMPAVELNSDDMKYTMMFFPLIGIVIGAIEYLVYRICGNYMIPDYVRGIVMSVIPIFITGGIHVDGYMDTMDAFNSYGDKEKKLAIMKDPHAGGFAIIYLLVYSSLFFGFTSLLNDISILQYCFIFTIGRVLSGISVVTIDGAKKEGMLRDIKKNSEAKVILTILCVIGVVTIGFLAFINTAIAVVILAAAILGYVSYKRIAIKNFGGITGDTSGWYLCIMELAFVVFITLGGII